MPGCNNSALFYQIFVYLQFDEQCPHQLQVMLRALYENHKASVDRIELWERAILNGRSP